jgi:hypothetical protein
MVEGEGVGGVVPIVHDCSQQLIVLRLRHSYARSPLRAPELKLGLNAPMAAIADVPEWFR